MLKDIDIPDADVRYDAEAFAHVRADALFAALHAEIPWQRHRIRLFGREIESPRLSCWIGEADAIYAYSGTRFEPQPWTPTVVLLRDELNARIGVTFNSVLANLYRDGRDSIGWHSDDEPELGPRPLIASLSFGAVRRFRLRDRHDPRRTFVLDLVHGSLLVMAGGTQARYRHDLPKTPAVVGPRINLTFRCIRPKRL